MVMCVASGKIIMVWQESDTCRKCYFIVPNISFSEHVFEIGQARVNRCYFSKSRNYHLSHQFQKKVQCKLFCP